MAPIDRILKVEGQVPQHVGVELADLAHNVSGQHVIVDVGTYRGRSAAYLAYGANQGGKAVVHAIDAWDLPGNKPVKNFRYNHPGSRKAARYNVRAQGFANDIVLTRSFSQDAARTWTGRPIGLLHLDADPHTIEDDILAWLPHVPPMGVIAVSDYHGSPKPSQAVSSLAQAKKVDEYSTSSGLILIQVPPRVGKVDPPVTTGFHRKMETEPVPMPDPDGPETEPVPMPDPDTTYEVQTHTIDTEPDQKILEDLSTMKTGELRDYMKSIGMRPGSNRPKKEMIADIREFLETGE